MSNLRVEDLNLNYQNKIVFNEFNLELPVGKITTFIGPNGSGKSSLLKTMARIIKPQKGCVLIEGTCIHRLPTKELAQRMAILPQHAVIPERLTVYDLVLLGRYPHQSFLGGTKKQDHEAVIKALEDTGMSSFANTFLENLSGGQRQLVWIAMALAQDTPYLFLDEPTTYLDMAHQLEIMKLLVKLNREYGKTIVMVLHDINQAAAYSNELILLSKGHVYTQGKPEQVLTKKALRDVFNIEACFIRDSDTNAMYCVPVAVS